MRHWAMVSLQPQVQFSEFMRFSARRFCSGCQALEIDARKHRWRSRRFSGRSALINEGFNRDVDVFAQQRADFAVVHLGGVQPHVLLHHAAVGVDEECRGKRGYAAVLREIPPLPITIG